MKYLPLALIALSIIPSVAFADIEAPPEPGTVPFEEAAKLTLAMEVEGHPLHDLATSSLKANQPYTFAYAVGYENEWFYDPGGELDEEARTAEFTETLAANRSYISLWRGEPLAPEAELVGSWDISGNPSGTITATLPGEGPYFFLFDIPNYVLRNPEAECARVADPIELCLPEATLGMDVEDSWRYIRLPGASFEWNGGVYTPIGFGGVRFQVAPAAPPAGASSILFLPGIQGSRLYQNVLGIENKRWELSIGMSQLDARALYFDATGESVNPIYTKDGEVVARVELPALGFDVYRTFLAQLEALKTGETINDYLAFPYDWRMDPLTVVEEGTAYADGTRSVTEAVETLAASSRTGKVTIVGHSNGGLVAKALMRKLEREGKEGLVDSVVFVDVPQLGTPEAIAPMLHGDFGALTSFGGLYLSKPNARGLAEYMPDAYALLPSSSYFNQVSDPVIDLTEAPQLLAASGLPSPTISSEADFERFITSAGGRVKPAAGDIETPNTLSPALLAKARELHDALDTWTPPPGVRAVQVAGWGIDTAKGIEYVERMKKDCALLIFSCRDVTELTHRVLMTPDGDQTVVLASQAPAPGIPTYYLDLPKANIDLDKNWRHANMTESAPFQEVFPLLIGAAPGQPLPAYVSTTSPTAPPEKRLRLRVLSPVTLHAYDAAGRHTGPAANPDPHSDLLYKEEEIPNSYYEEFGEGKYLGLPASGSVRIEMQGLAPGTFTYEIASVSGDKIETRTYEDIPVTASTTARMDIQEGAVETAPLVLDTNGDGRTDAEVVSAAQTGSPLTYIRLIRLSLETMGLGTTTKRQLSAKFANVENLLLKNGTWDDTDDDADRKGAKKGERVGKRVLRKLDTIDLWIGVQLLQWKLSDAMKRSVGGTLDPAQAEALLNMTRSLRTLIK